MLGQASLPVAIWAIQCDVDGLVGLLLRIEHATSGPCVPIALVLTLLLQSLLFCNPGHDLIVLATFVEAWRHVLYKSWPAPVLEVLQAALSFEIDAPRVELARG